MNKYVKSLWVVYACVLAVVAGCATLNPNKATEVTVKSVLVLSAYVDDAQKRGYIDNSTEDRLQNKLIDVLKLLQNTYTVLDVNDCASAGIDVPSQCVDTILGQVEDALRKAGANVPTTEGGDQ